MKEIIENQEAYSLYLSYLQTKMNALVPPMVREILTPLTFKRVFIYYQKNLKGETGLLLGQELEKAGKEVFYKASDSSASDDIDSKEDDLLIDAYALGNELKEEEKRTVEAFNKRKGRKISLLVPSGINPLTGEGETYAEADCTLSVSPLLAGNYLDNGLNASREVRSIFNIDPDFKGQTYLLEKADLKGFYPKRRRNTNKGSYGSTGIIGGSSLYYGAPLLSSSASSSYRMGTGYSHLFVPKSVFSHYVVSDPQVLVSEVGEKDGFIDLKEDDFLKVLKCRSLAFGMGCGVSKSVYDSLVLLLKNYKGILIIDADGLNSLAKYGSEVLKDHQCEVIITPHLKEFSRLTGQAVSDIKRHVFSLGRKFAKDHQVTLVLKSASTVVFNKDGKEAVISSFGNSGLAKAGSGDLLSGLIAGLASVNSSFPYMDALAGVFILGRCAEERGKKQPEFTLTAADILKEIPDVAKEIV